MGHTRPSGSLGTLTIIFQADIEDIHDYAHQGFQGTQITKFSGGQTVIRALNSHIITSYLVWECYCILCVLAYRIKVKLGCIPWHWRCLGNDHTLARSRVRSTSWPETSI